MTDAEILESVCTRLIERASVVQYHTWPKGSPPQAELSVRQSGRCTIAVTGGLLLARWVESAASMPVGYAKQVQTDDDVEHALYAIAVMLEENSRYSRADMIGDGRYISSVLHIAGRAVGAADAYLETAGDGKEEGALYMPNGEVCRILISPGITYATYPKRGISATGAWWRTELNEYADADRVAEFIYRMQRST